MSAASERASKCFDGGGGRGHKGAAPRRVRCRLPRGQGALSPPCRVTKSGCAGVAGGRWPSRRRAIQGAPAVFSWAPSRGAARIPPARIPEVSRWRRVSARRACGRLNRSPLLTLVNQGASPPGLRPSLVRSLPCHFRTRLGLRSLAAQRHQRTAVERSDSQRRVARAPLQGYCGHTFAWVVAFVVPAVRSRTVAARG